MGIFSVIGGALKGGVGGFLKGGPIGALTGGASGALGGLLGGEGLKGALRGGIGGLLGGQAGQQAGLSPAAIAALTGISSAQLAERGKQRESAEAAFNARQDLLTRNLGLAEQSFKDKAPLRNFGINSLGRFAQGGFGRGIFQTPAEMGQETGSLAGAPIFKGNFAGNSLFGPPGGEDKKPDLPTPKTPKEPKRSPAPARKRGKSRGGRTSQGGGSSFAFSDRDNKGDEDESAPESREQRLF